MEELFFIVLGLYMIYSVGHLVILQKKAWCMRVGYEKFVTVFAIVTIVLLILDAMIN